MALRQAQGNRKDSTDLNLMYPGLEEPTDKAGDRWFSKVEVPFSVYTINADSGGYFWHPSGTWVYIPPKAFQTEGGKSVSGKMAINFREFREQSELAFSGFPMRPEKGNHARSAGMFEIKAYSYNYDGKIRLKPAKEIIVDFALIDTMADVRLTKLDQLKGSWWVVNEIEESDLRTYGGVHFDRYIHKTRDHTFFQKVYKATTGWAWSEERKIAWPEMARGKVTGEEAEDRERGLEPVHSAEETDSTFAFAPQEGDRNYPTVVRGLTIDNLGVYDCNAKYKVGNSEEVYARFVNEERREIKRVRDVIVIDLKKNTTFTFRSDERIAFDLSSEQALLVVTEGNEIYFMDSEELQKIDLTKGGRVEFMIQDISVDVEAPKDLRSFLTGSKYASSKRLAPYECEEGNSLVSDR